MRQHPTREEISKVLGEPVGFDISEMAAKLRRNLILVSVVVLVLILGEIEAGSDFSILGIKLTGVTPFKLMVGLAIVLAYTFAHFIWYCYELYSAWAIRLTGTKLLFVTGAKLGATGADYPDDPKQSTLYTWWAQEAKSMAAYSDLVSRVDESIRKFSVHVEQLELRDMTRAGSVSSSIQGMKHTLEQVRGAFASTESVITNTRIPESLSRFDRRFRLLLKSQNLRVVVVEAVLPIILSLAAAYYLLRFFVQI
ncbi:hypothetical protein JET64_02375 [Pseudomonas putida]|nr:hypothetical protein [Pseudomonas putida]